MKNRTFIMFILLSLSLSAQPKLSRKDSIDVTTTFKKLIKSLELQDRKATLELCLDEVECSSNADVTLEEFEGYDYFIPREEFYEKLLVNVIKSPVYKAYKKRGFTVSVNSVENYQPRNIEKNEGKNLVLYEVFIQTYLQNEWVDGHEGQTNIFQFVKLGSEIKLFGITSVP